MTILWWIRNDHEDMEAELGLPSKRGKPLHQYFEMNAKQGPRGAPYCSDAKNQIFLIVLDRCVDKAQAKQVAARGAMQEGSDDVQATEYDGCCSQGAAEENRGN